MIVLTPIPSLSLSVSLILSPAGHCWQRRSSYSVQAWCFTGCSVCEVSENGSTQSEISALIFRVSAWTCPRSLACRPWCCSQVTASITHTVRRTDLCFPFPLPLNIPRFPALTFTPLCVDADYLRCGTGDDRDWVYLHGRTNPLLITAKESKQETHRERE